MRLGSLKSSSFSSLSWLLLLGPRPSQEAPFNGFAAGGGSSGVYLWLVPEPVALDS